MKNKGFIALLGVSVAAAHLGVTVASPSAAGAQVLGAQAVGCTHVAAAGGNDAGSGTDGAPYLSLARLLQSLAPGEVGCLRGGDVFSENITVTPAGPAGHRAGMEFSRHHERVAGPPGGDS